MLYIIFPFLSYVPLPFGVRQSDLVNNFFRHIFLHSVVSDTFSHPGPLEKYFKMHSFCLHLTALANKINLPSHLSC